eukprot:1484116-Rhodomonas_salina.1
MHAHIHKHTPTWVATPALLVVVVEIAVEIVEDSLIACWATFKYHLPQGVARLPYGTWRQTPQKHPRAAYRPDLHRSSRHKSEFETECWNPPEDTRVDDGNLVSFTQSPEVFFEFEAKDVGFGSRAVSQPERRAYSEEQQLEEQHEGKVNGAGERTSAGEDAGRRAKAKSCKERNGRRERKKKSNTIRESKKKGRSGKGGTVPDTAGKCDIVSLPH